jgi:hypothetical protein
VATSTVIPYNILILLEDSSTLGEDPLKQRKGRSQATRRRAPDERQDGGGVTLSSDIPAVFRGQTYSGLMLGAQ